LDTEERESQGSKFIWQAYISNDSCLEAQDFSVFLYAFL